MTSSTDFIVAEAQRRGVAVTQFSEVDPQFAILQYQQHQEFIYYSGTDRLGQATRKLLGNKRLTNIVLRQHGFSVPEASLVASAAEAEPFLKTFGRVVIKPVDLAWGRGVTPDITTSAQLAVAFERAQAVMSKPGSVICEQHVVGADYRFMVIDQQHVWVAQRTPAQVIGDGQLRVNDLVAQYNASAVVEKHIQLTNQTAQELLGEQGVTEETVLAAGQVLRLARVANTHAGGAIRDVTAEVPEAILEQARAVARTLRLKVVGVDCISPDARQEFGTIIELNEVPDLRYPETPVQDGIVQAFVTMLFPETAER